MKVRSRKIKWTVYFFLLILALVLNFHQNLVELWMRFAVRNQKVVISLSTTPYRINQIQPTLDSILKQNLKPQAIYLNIPYVFKRDNLEYIIPNWLFENKKLTILRSEDYGPATKLLGTLDQTSLDPETIIITMDDDIIYPKSTVLHLVYKAMHEPNKAIALCGSNLDPSSATGLMIDIKADKQVAIAQGFAGVAYRRRFFDQDIFRILQAPRACINSDDLYISFYLAQHNIPRQILRNRYISVYKVDFLQAIGHQNDALHNLVPPPIEKHRECVAYMQNLAPGVSFN